jgi:hypothetical protein
MQLTTISYRVLIERLEGKSQLISHKCRWEDAIEMEFEEIWKEGCEMDSYGLEQGWFLGCCTHGNEPTGFIKCWEFLEWLRNCLASQAVLRAMGLVSQPFNQSGILCLQM